MPRATTEFDSATNRVQLSVEIRMTEKFPFRAVTGDDHAAFSGRSTLHASMALDISSASAALATGNVSQLSA